MLNNNPYILLGVPYGSSSKEINAALAKKTQAINNGELQGVTVEELTSAANLIENKTNKENEDIFRIPASETILTPKFYLNIYDIEENEEIIQETYLIKNEKQLKETHSVTTASVREEKTTSGVRLGFTIITAIFWFLLILPLLLSFINYYNQSIVNSSNDSSEYVEEAEPSFDAELADEKEKARSYGYTIYDDNFAYSWDSTEEALNEDECLEQDCIFQRIKIYSLQNGCYNPTIYVSFLNSSGRLINSEEEFYLGIMNRGDMTTLQVEESYYSEVSEVSILDITCDRFL